jgi:ABC-type polar amino acid transport system ATPase subunit
MLQAENITKSYGKHLVLDDISLELAPGTITTLIGPSGSGKSTLLRALSLLETPDSGSISLNGRTYEFGQGQKNEIKPPWPEVTVVFQQLFLWPHMTLRQNIALPLKKCGIGHALKTVNTLIEQLDMKDFADRHPNEVSIGQRQIAALARAFALQPKFLLLDEITSALDIEYVTAILKKLNALRDQGIGILLVTHIIGFARRSASQVLFMDKGKIVETGGPEILTEPKTQRMKEFISLVSYAH